jgi:Ca-activated chloride channel family protein
MVVLLTLGGLASGSLDRASMAQSIQAQGALPPVPKKSLPGGAEITLDFGYGTEKEKWIESVTEQFNASGVRTPSGSRIVVKTYGTGSGQMMDDLLSERKKYHLVSPAAKAYIVKGNADARESGKETLIGDTRDLVLSPIVIMMWRETAEKFEWPAKPVKWRDLFDAARDPAGWAGKAGAAAGPFRLGHTQPLQSNSGLYAVLLEACAATGKFDDLLPTDITSPEVAKFFADVEKAIPYYEKSTGTLARRMVREGSEKLSAAIVYENLVIEANRETAASGQPPKVVAIYPEEGTFPSDHPAGIVNRPWVTEEHKQAAKLYIDFLLANPQQLAAKKYGFRPSDPSLKADDILTPLLGVNSAVPKYLEVPQANTINQVLDLWMKNKNPDAVTVQNP